MTFSPLSLIPEIEVRQALKAGALFLEAGPFVTRLTIREPGGIAFFRDMYQDFGVRIDEAMLADFALELRAPNRFREFFRKQIVPDPGFYFPAVPLPINLSPLCLEMGLNLCVALQCFQHVIFHAGVVARDDEAIVIAARSGGGKSTLTAALMENGYRLLSDEFAILETKNNSLLPYPRPVSLKNQSIDIVSGFAGANQVSDVLKETPKGNIAYRRVRESDFAASEIPARARTIVFPRFQHGSLPSVTKLETVDAAMQLIASSPNYQVIGEPAFHALMSLLDGVEAFELVYGTTEASLKLVNDLWEGAHGA